MKTYGVTFDQKPNYLHAVVTGRNSKENVAGYLEEVHRECVARGGDRLLIEERLEGPRLGTMEVFAIVTQGSSRSFGMFKAIAYVDVHADGGLMKFAETVAVNRSMPVRIFAIVAEAEKWLLEGDRGGAEFHTAAGAKKPLPAKS